MTIKPMVAREQKIRLVPVGENTFDIKDAKGKELISADESYFIYLKKANLKANGEIEGRFMGENPDKIIDKHCKEITFSSDVKEWKSEKSGETFTTARLVAINNKTGVTFIL